MGYVTSDVHHPRPRKAKLRVRFWRQELLVCLPGATGTAEIYFRQILGLCPKGYRVVAVRLYKGGVWQLN